VPRREQVEASRRRNRARGISAAKVRELREGTFSEDELKAAREAGPAPVREERCRRCGAVWRVSGISVRACPSCGGDVA
jgi:rubrerythrin